MMRPESSSLPATAKPSKKNLSLGLMALAVLSSIVASTCCVVPLVLVLVGITGAWMATLTSLPSAITPIFASIALVTLGWAAFLIFRPERACIGPDGAACETTPRSTRLIFLACALFIVLLQLFPLVASYFY